MTPLRQRTLAALLAACFSLCALYASDAHADEAPDASVESPAWLAKKTAPKTAKPVAGGPAVGLGRSMGVLVLVSLLGGAALYLRSRKNKAPKTRLAGMRVVSATKLGGKAQLVLAEVEGRKILLGVTDSSVRKLGWLDAEQPAEQEDEDFEPVRPRLVAAGVNLAAQRATPARPKVEVEEPVAPPKRSFRDMLAHAVGNLGAPKFDDESVASMIADETQDTFTRSSPRGPEPQRPAASPAAPRMVDVEGQAKGLLARLGEPRK